MLYSNILELCNVIGKKDLISEEPWKALKYIYLADYPIDVEKYLETGDISMHPDQNAFSVKTYACNTGSLVDDKNIRVNAFSTFDRVEQVSVLIDPVVDIYDIVKLITPTKYEVKIKFKWLPEINSLGEYVFKRCQTIDIPYTMSRDLTDADYTITTTNLETGDPVETAAGTPGRYKISIQCVGNYNGSAECILVVI